VLRAGWPSGVTLLDERSLALLEGLGEDPPAGALAVLVCEFADVTRDAGELVGRGLLGPAADRDFAALAPASGRWTVPEVAQITARFHHHPEVRHVVFLGQAETLDRRSMDRLLLLTEEPPSPLLLLLGVPRVEQLPATIRGRATTVLELDVLPAPARVRALVERGVAETTARDAVELAGVRPSLAGPLAADSTLRELAREALDPRLDHRAPLEGAERRVLALAALAAALSRVRADPTRAVEVRPRRYEELDPEEKLLFRELVEVWAQHRRRTLVALLGELPAVAVTDLEACLREIERLQERLLVPVTPATAFAALALSSPPIRPARGAR